ncbi:3-hydroxyacyl-CoA dehydrogenase NAD-binding domain-containing protein [Acidobacteria bacterium AH-259-A15]|nr:3-hydroxyacyl-CoA dehydrogenase NAD-binding domain-containing protein [Acidobacteria bacterium AH-259-A15]
MSDLVSYTVDSTGTIGVIEINNPPVNALSPGVPEGISEALSAALEDGAVKAVVLIGRGRTFIAGADIKEFGKITSGQRRRGAGLHPLLNVLEDSPKPVICAIHGTALGGGLEVAMACHYRVAVAAAQVGQPEVKLGIIPGAGGTQRLPRLIGVARAAEMCAVGSPLSAADACEWGLIDRIVHGDLREGAIAYAAEVVAEGKPPRKTRDLEERLDQSESTKEALAQLRQQVAKRSRGMMAPLKAIEAVEAASTLSFEQGVRQEGEIFRECLFSDQSKALIHVFFGERQVRKIPGIAKDIPLIEIKKAAVLGAGTMGGGIAMNYAKAGIPVLVKEVNQERLDQGMQVIRRNYETTMKRGRLTQQEVDQRMARIIPTLTYDGFGEADIVVEAVFESMDLKKKVFGELETVARPDAILASNTSTLNIDEIASATSRPEMVIGHHFFSPANVMKLFEIVRGKRTSHSVIATSMALARRLGKVGVLVGNCTGFVGNRMFDPYMREAQFLVEEGANVQELDAALYEFGMAMGPLAVGDLAGLDVGWRIRKEHAHLVPEGMRQPLVADRICEMGRFGQKTGAGWYKYEEGSRTPIPDPEIQQLVEKTAAAAGIEQQRIGPQEIVERTVYALVNEAARLLEEGFALRAVDIDIIYLYGYGFPAHRGGPMWYADTVGLEKVYERVCDFEKQQGFWWKPAGLLKQLAEEGRTFADFDQSGYNHRSDSGFHRPTRS